MPKWVRHEKPGGAEPDGHVTAKGIPGDGGANGGNGEESGAHVDAALVTPSSPRIVQRKVGVESQAIHRDRRTGMQATHEGRLGMGVASERVKRRDGEARMVDRAMARLL